MIARMRKIIANSKMTKITDQIHKQNSLKT